jgi:hypothetical protein
LEADETKRSCESSDDRDVDEEGFDISLIREMLRMSPDERLDWHHGIVRIIEELRHAAEL